MQIIDLTPNRDENGKVSLLGIVQGTLKYGFSYPKMLAAQDAIQSQLKKRLGSTFYLLRNVILPRSDILVPFILVGPAGVYVIQPTYQTGIYQARGAEWGVLDKERFKPAAINLLKKTANLTRAVQVYLRRQGIDLDAINGVLMAADPGLHIESTRPIVRVLMYDAIPGFARSLSQERGLLSSAEAKTIVRRLQKPRGADEKEDESEALQPEDFFTPSETPASDDLTQAFAFNPEDKDAPAEEDASEPPIPPEIKPRPKPKSPPPAQLPLGLTQQQWLLLIGMFVIEILIIFGFLFFILLTNA